MSVNPMHYPVCGAALAAVLSPDFGRSEAPTFCELREGHHGDHRGELCGTTCRHPNETKPKGDAMTLRDVAAESWEALAALEPPKYPEAEDPDRATIYARREAIREARDRMDDETAHARVLARRGLPAEAWAEGDPRLAAWRTILWERLPSAWVNAGLSDFAPRNDYTSDGLRSVARLGLDAGAALALLLADAERRTPDADGHHRPIAAGS